MWWKGTQWIVLKSLVLPTLGLCLCQVTLLFLLLKKQSLSLSFNSGLTMTSFGQQHISGCGNTEGLKRSPPSGLALLCLCRWLVVRMPVLTTWSQEKGDRHTTETFSPSLTHRLVRKNDWCFKPLSFGIVCYMTLFFFFWSIATWIRK